MSRKHSDFINGYKLTFVKITMCPVFFWHPQIIKYKKNFVDAAIAFIFLLMLTRSEDSVHLIEQLLGHGMVAGTRRLCADTYTVFVGVMVSRPPSNNNPVVQHSTATATR